MIIKTYNIHYSFGNSYEKYENPEFLNNIQIKKELEIVEDIVDLAKQESPDLAENDVFSSIGRIFEKNGSFKVAGDFFQKVLKNVKNNKKQAEDTLFDLNRVREKESAAKNGLNGGVNL